MSIASRSTALVTPEWLAAHKDDPSIHVIEVEGMRPDNLELYQSGHVPGARYWKWKEMFWDADERDFPSPEEFARRAAQAGIGNDSTVVFYAEEAQFGVYAWWVFRYCGHAKVCVLDGGRRRWARQGLPLERQVPPAAPPAEYRPGSRDEAMRAARDEVLATLGRGDTLLLDGRSPEEYRGELLGPPGSPDVGAMRYGRIPGALTLPFSTLLNDDTSFRTPQELLALVTERGVTDETDVITYCRLGHRATVLYFVLTELLGFRRVRVYDGSWIEWGNLVRAPIER